MGAPDGRFPAPTLSELQTVAPQREEILLESIKAIVVPPQSQLLHVAAEQLPHWMLAVVGRKHRPQQRPQ